MKRDDAADDEVIDGFFRRFDRLHRHVRTLEGEVEDADSSDQKWKSMRFLLDEAAYTAKQIMDDIHEIRDYLDNPERMAALIEVLKARGTDA